MAPLTVHVHALTSKLETGDPLTARYDWDFGDPGGQFNTLSGWNAAHIYDHPGTYVVTLRITDEQGRQLTATHEVVIQPAERRAIHVSNRGSDANSGSIDQPLRTLAKAAQLVRRNGAILLHRDGIYDISATIELPWSNIVIGAYGEGPNPVLQWIGDEQTVAAILDQGDSSRDVVIENLVFDSPVVPPTISSVRAIHPAGKNLTVRGCTFRRISFALNCEQNIDDLLALNNTAEIIGAYFSWAQGSDHTYLGNLCAGSTSQHIIRLGGVRRCLIAHNEITNQTNSTIWAMLGTNVYIAHNTLRQGRCLVGPNRAEGEAAERFPWAVIESNRMIDEGFGVAAGGEHIVIRNNIIQRDDGSAITVHGHDQDKNRTAFDVRVLNNTAINSAPGGRFINIGKDVRGLLVANNMYVAPNLETGANQTANVFLQDEDMEGVSFRSNLWSNPVKRSWGNGWHYRWPTWSDVRGYLDTRQWAMCPNVYDEHYRSFAGDDLDEQCMPGFEAALGEALPNVTGVQVDFYGKARTLKSPITVGAVERPK